MIVFETKFYPLVLLSFRGKDHDEADYRGLMASTAHVARRSIGAGLKYVTITLFSAQPSTAERKLVNRLMAEYPEELLCLLAGSYVVAESSIARALIAALRWISPKLRGIEAVASNDDALAAATATLERYGIELDGAQVAAAQRWLDTEREWHRRARAA
jgi:hypothetical protein